MTQTEAQSSTDNKFRLMEEEMNRFEAEIAHHQTDAATETVNVVAPPGDTGAMSATVAAATPPIGYSASVMGLSFVAPQPVVATVPNAYQPPLQSASSVINPLLFPSLGVPPAQPMYMPPQMVAYQPTTLLPTNFYTPSANTIFPTPVGQQTAVRHTSSYAGQVEKSSSSLVRKPSASAEAKSKAPAATVIVAPPQMAGPTELAARAKETAAARFKASSSTKRHRKPTTPVEQQQDDDADIEVDDDVTRALLAAAAGVTYTRVQASDGTNKTVVKTAPTQSVTPSLASGKPAVTSASLGGAAATATSTGSSSSVPSSRQPKPTQAPLPLLPQQQQAQQQPSSIMPLMSVPPPNYRYPTTTGNSSSKDASKKGGKRFLRIAAGTVWEDPTLSEWDPNDFRIFCGDLGNEVSVDTLSRAFNRYPSFQKAHVVRDKRTSKSRGYGFVSFSDPTDFARAMREMNGKYVGNRPIKLKRSDWRVRQLDTFKKKEKEKRKLGLKN